MTTIAFDTHDHHACISTGLSAVEAACKSAGLRLTPVRRRVLEILLQEHRAMGAYEVLERLSDEGLGSKPPLAYRALNFLVSNGFAHRIERLNAFIACSHLGARHAPAFLICKVCNAVAEAHLYATAGRLGDAADAAGFKIERVVIEAEGICPNCQAQA